MRIFLVCLKPTVKKDLLQDLTREIERSWKRWSDSYVSTLCNPLGVQGFKLHQFTKKATEKIRRKRRKDSFKRFEERVTKITPEESRENWRSKSKKTEKSEIRNAFVQKNLSKNWGYDQRKFQKETKFKRSAQQKQQKYSYPARETNNFEEEE